MTGLANTVRLWRAGKALCLKGFVCHSWGYTNLIRCIESFFLPKFCQLKKRHALHACTHHHTRHSFTSVTAWVAEITLFILSVVPQYNERMTHFMCNFHVNNRVLCFPLSVADTEFYLLRSWRVTLATVHTGQTHQGFNGNGAGSSDRGGVKYSLHTGLLDVY